MRRLISLLLLLAAVLAQTPVACPAGTHVPRAEAEPAAHVHHAQHAGHAADDRANASTGGARLAHDAGAHDDDPAPSCAALARCHTSALPEPNGTAMLEAHGPEQGWHAVGPQPAEPVASFPTPPPRQLS